MLQLDDGHSMGWHSIGVRMTQRPILSHNPTQFVNKWIPSVQGSGKIVVTHLSWQAYYRYHDWCLLLEFFYALIYPHVIEHEIQWKHVRWFEFMITSIGGFRKLHPHDRL